MQTIQMLEGLQALFGGEAVTRGADRPTVAIGHAVIPEREVLVMTGASRQARVSAALDVVRRRLGARPSTRLIIDRAPDEWPFRRHPLADLPAGGDLLVWVDDVERAFPSPRDKGARLVLTQATYQLQRCLEALRANESSMLLATADESALLRVAPDMRAGRGPWRSVQVVNLDEHDASTGVPDSAPVSVSETGGRRPDLTAGMLADAFGGSSIADWLRACERAVAAAPQSAVARLALASACREHGAADDARAALEEAARLAPEWEAVHFERGKLWLRDRDHVRAREAFARAGALMPSFAAAFGYLGATLGELGRVDEALRAFQQALCADPTWYAAHNDIGVLNRALGRLEESAAALRRVTDLAPAFAGGHYNLGHTLFLQGRFDEALAAFREGQARDPTKHVRAASRLGLLRLATGDPEGAAADLRSAFARVRAEGRLDLAGEALEIVEVLAALDPGLAGTGELRAALSQVVERARQEEL